MEPTLATPPRHSRRGCFWKGLLVFLAVLLLAALFLGWQVHRTKSWIENAPESSPAALPQVSLSQEEEAGVARLYADYEKCWREKRDLDVVLTPAELNRIAEDHARKDKANGKQEPDLEALHLSFEGQETVVRGTAPVRDRPGMHYNFEVCGNVTVDHGHATWSVDSVKLRGQEAPWMARMFALYGLRKKQAEQEELSAKGQDSFFSRVKLLRREGDKVHLIVDGAHLEPPGD